MLVNGKNVEKKKNPHMLKHPNTKMFIRFRSRISINTEFVNWLYAHHLSVVEDKKVAESLRMKEYTVIDLVYMSYGVDRRELLREHNAPNVPCSVCGHPQIEHDGKRYTPEGEQKWRWAETGCKHSNCNCCQFIESEGEL
jgi:hypothetical protein